MIKNWNILSKREKKKFISATKSCCHCGRDVTWGYSKKPGSMGEQPTNLDGSKHTCDSLKPGIKINEFTK